MALSEIPPDAITIDMIGVSGFDVEVNRSTHEKVAPCTIVAQAYEGQYGMVCGERRAVSEPGGAFLATAGDSLNITHIGDPRTGRMKARWLHASFWLYGTIDLFSLIRLPLVVSAEEGHRFGAWIEEMRHMEDGGSLTQAIRRQELAFSCARRLLEIGAPRPRMGIWVEQAGRVRQLWAFIEERLAKPLAVEDLAQAACMSRSALHAFFRNVMGGTPMQYVQKTRVRKAARLLATTDAPVYAVAEEVGFSNPYHFSRVFTSIQGLTPTAYRKASVWTDGFS